MNTKDRLDAKNREILGSIFSYTIRGDRMFEEVLPENTINVVQKIYIKTVF